MTVFGAQEQRVERLTIFVSLALALILHLFAGLLLVRMCREEVFRCPPPVSLITFNLAPEAAPAAPAKIAVPAPDEETEKVSQAPEISQPQPEPQTPKTLPIEPPALQKTEELKKLESLEKPGISKKVEFKPLKPSQKKIEKPIEKNVLKPAEKPAPQPEPVKASATPESFLSTQPRVPAFPESAVTALSSAAQTDKNAVSQTEKPVKALSGEEQKAIARYLAQVRRSLDRSRVYPSEARKKRIEGVVLVKFRISEDGLVVGAEVSGNAPGILAEAVIQMLAGRRFPPPPTGWQPSAAVELNINFNIR